MHHALPFAFALSLPCSRALCNSLAPHARTRTHAEAAERAPVCGTVCVCGRYGSRMAWHPECRIGVIGLANGRYAGPYSAVVEATATLAASGTFPRQLRIEAHPEICTRIRPLIDSALMDGDIRAIIPSLASNVEQDRALASRAAEFTGLAAIHGQLTPEDGLTVTAPTRVSWWLRGAAGSRVGVPPRSSWSIRRPC